jgi:predicted MFS family arabinose efflux permease
MHSLTTLFKNAYGGISLEVWWLSVATLINRSGTMVILFLSVYLTQHLHFTIQNAGVIMAMFGAGSVLGVFVGGKLSDKLGHFPVIVGSLVGGGIMFAVLAQIETYFAIAACTFITSTMSEAFRPPAMVAISVYSTRQTYTRSISLYRLAINLGFSIGPAIGGFMALYNYKLIFYGDSVTCLAAAVIIYFLLDNRKKEIAVDSKVVSQSKSAYRNKPYLIFIFFSFLYAMAFFQFFSTMPLFYKLVHHLKETEIGWILALNGIIVAAIEMILIYKVEKRWTYFNFIFLGAMLLAISYFSLLIFDSVFWLYMIVIIISFSEMFAMPFMNSYMNSRTNENNKGQYAALYAMSWSLAQICIPVIATQTIVHFGYDVLWIILGAFAVAVGVGIKWVEKMS